MSKIEVNTVDAQCGSTVTIGSAGKTVSVPGNIVKTNALQASDGGNIVNQCGTTVTLGASGDTIALASGASQTGFGRTGTVDWVTTPKVTGDSPITAVTGKGYFLNTTAGVITVNLPAGAAGSIVSMADYAGTWQTNKVTVSPNGSEKIGGTNATATLDTEGQSVTFVYVDAVQGWVNTMDSTSNVRGGTFITATGGTPCSGAIVCTNYKVHTFTGPGTFCVSAGAGPLARADYMVVAGGGGGAGRASGGGGAGGYRESPGTASGCYAVSPLGAAPAVALPLSVQGYPIVVGGGGAGGSPPGEKVGVNGSTSTFSTIDSAGGGGGSGGGCVGSGGSGGGGSYGGATGTGNTPPTTPPQGNNGGAASSVLHNGSGGGGAGAVGVVGTAPTAGAGGAGVTTSIDATPTVRAGGGGASSFYSPNPAPGGAGGSGGGGAGAPGTPSGAVGTAGSANTGGGGGGGNTGSPGTGGCGGLGGSGIVIIRYKFQ